MENKSAAEKFNWDETRSYHCFLRSLGGPARRVLLSRLSQSETLHYTLSGHVLA